MPDTAPPENNTAAPDADLKAIRELIGAKLTEARRLDAEATQFRAAGKSTAEIDFALAKTIAEIRIELNAAVDLLEREAGTRWTPGLRAVHFVRELRTTKGTLAAQSVIFDRFGFAVDQIAGRSPNDKQSVSFAL